MRFENILTILYFLSTTYSFGGGVVEGVVNYPAWKIVNATDFIEYHQFVGSRLIIFFVSVFFLSVPISVLMIWFRHPAISRNLMLIAVVLNLFIFAVTITLAIPIQTHLAQGKSIELIDSLIFYDNYFRILPGLILMIINAFMLTQILRKATI